MNDAQVRLRWLWPGLLLVCFTLACNAAQFLGEETAATDVSPAPADPVSDENVAPEAVWAAEQAALNTALASRFEPETAFVAVAAAMERGYTYDPLRAGILDERLQEDGQILQADGSVLEPDGEPAGILDLSDLSTGIDRVRSFKPDPRKQQAVSTITATELLQGIEAFAATSADEDAISGEYRLTIIILILRRTGYTFDQIVAAIVLGDDFVTTPACGYLLESDPESGQQSVVIPGAYTYNPVLDRDDPCAVAPKKEAATEELSAEAPVDPPGTDDGDIAAFCTIYETMLNELVTQIDLYEDAVSDPNCDGCGRPFVDTAENALEAAYDNMLTVAPAEIRDSVAYMSSQQLVGVFLTLDVLPVELEGHFLLIDNFATANCESSFELLNRESED